MNEIDVYFSHSFRRPDRGINDYFNRLLNESGVRLLADRKESSTWCVPKLERYMTEVKGFIAIIPFREDVDPSFPFAFSKYIAFELRLARRARLPRRVFVEDRIFRAFSEARLDPEIEPIFFSREAPQRDEPMHRWLIQQFADFLRQTAAGRSPPISSPRVAVFLGEDDDADIVGHLLSESLEHEAYQARLIPAAEAATCAHDLSAFDAICSANVSVFCLGPKLAPTDTALAIAHGLCRPAFRICRGGGVPPGDPDLNGLVRWESLDQLRPLFAEQIRSYRLGFVEKILPTPSGRVEKELVLREWDPQEPLALAEFVEVGDGALAHIADAVSHRLDRGAPDLVGAGRHDDLCRAAYEQVLQYRWRYEFEPGSKDYLRQRIRNPSDLQHRNGGTCLDLACFFAALLEYVQANPVIVRLAWPGGAHALAGCWVRNRPGNKLLDRTRRPFLHDALRSGDLLLFETTGVAKWLIEDAGGMRTNGFLSYDQAKETACRLFEQVGVELHFLLDVLAVRGT